MKTARTHKRVVFFVCAVLFFVVATGVVADAGAGGKSLSAEEEGVALLEETPKVDSSTMSSLSSSDGVDNDAAAVYKKIGRAHV